MSQLHKPDERCESHEPARQTPTKPYKLARGKVAWQRFGKEYCLTGQYGSRPIFLCVRKGELMLRNSETDLLVPFHPEHEDAETIVDAINGRESQEKQEIVVYYDSDGEAHIHIDTPDEVKKWIEETGRTKEEIVWRGLVHGPVEDKE
jgi:hypothetical protein